MKPLEQGAFGARLKAACRPLHAIAALCFLLVISIPFAASAADDLLPAEEAFQVSARFVQPGMIEFNYRIAPQYYLYRDRFRFSLDKTSARLGAAQRPPGKIKQDATFGRVETYRDSVRILVPISPLTKDVADSAINVKAISQGCADAGICYPPQTHILKLKWGSPDTVLPSHSSDGPFSSAPPATSLSEQLKKTP
jgi:thiol:disulfide interchange protein DsbD